MRSIAYNAALFEAKHLIAYMCSYPIVPCEWNADTPSAQAIYETLENRTAGPPGLVVLRLPASAVELCVELWGFT